MTLPVVLRRRAINELNETYRWYENEREGLGHEFLSQFKQLGESVRESPQSFMRIDHKVRRASMERFPYNVFYQIEAKRIVILAVIHSSRHQSNWPQSRKRSH